MCILRRIPLLFLVMLTILPHAASAAKLGVAFCPADAESRSGPPSPDTITSVQPASQLERFTSISYETPSLSIEWSPSVSLCGRRPQSYYVTVSSSWRMLNPVLSALGGFPQNTCGQEGAEGANSAMTCAEGPCDACAEQWPEGCEEQKLTSKFAVSKAMIRLANLFPVAF
eukprot:CAMPEP_0182454442 /NCGR_PEP_ID=MMETSP1319-20130603/1077_1 /TAXON_ID=172717 /ORGANISM="Bolidomonas pacifica, Strain RCC208" /LENGTH=170 /DNA_ID=CAMNT_0024652455 /DNA_START=76 /DNA_END=585 /DNA_ORIENTATION=-